MLSNERFVVFVNKRVVVLIRVKPLECELLSILNSALHPGVTVGVAVRTSARSTIDARIFGIVFCSLAPGMNGVEMNKHINNCNGLAEQEPRYWNEDLQRKSRKATLNKMRT